MDVLQDNVSEVMATRIEMVSDTVPMAYAARLMADKHITGLPVTTEEGELIGVLSWSDVAAALKTKPGPSASSSFFGPHAPTVLLGAFSALETLTGAVRDHMSEKVISVGVDATIGDAARLMKRGEVHRVLVVDGVGNLAGLVSAIDIVHHLANAATAKEGEADE
jgi:CBS domain-containing protein